MNTVYFETNHGNWLMIDFHFTHIQIINNKMLFNSRIWVASLTFKNSKNDEKEKDLTVCKTMFVRQLIIIAVINFTSNEKP